LLVRFAFRHGGADDGAKSVQARESLAALEHFARSRRHKLDRKAPKMLVEACAPNHAQRIAGEQRRPRATGCAATNQPEMAAVMVRQNFQNRAGLAVWASGQHDGIV
jgi:hypothetical protein